MSARNRKILVVEDDKLNMKLVEALLQNGEYSVLQAENAEAGIQLAHNHRPDLILMDIQLPGMDGLRATRLIKKDKDLNEIPVVALTAHAMQGDAEKAIQAGCIGYISKPVDTRSFEKTIDGYLQDNDGERSS